MSRRNQSIDPGQCAWARFRRKTVDNVLTLSANAARRYGPKAHELLDQSSALDPDFGLVVGVGALAQKRPSPDTLARRGWAGPSRDPAFQSRSPAPCSQEMTVLLADRIGSASTACARCRRGLFRCTDAMAPPAMLARLQAQMPDGNGSTVIPAVPCRRTLDILRELGTQSKTRDKAMSAFNELSD